MSEALAEIEAVISDAGGVLLYPDLDWLSEQLALAGISRDRPALHRAYYRMIHTVDLHPELDYRGLALTSLEVRRWMMLRLAEGAEVNPEQRDGLAHRLARAAQDRFPGEGDIYHWSMPGLRQRLRKLARAGFRLAVASNNDGSLETQLATIGVAELFEARLDSFVEGVAKPEPELLLRAARALEVLPERCLYVGDIDRVDGAAARAAGMHFALLDPLAQPRPSSPLIIGDLVEIERHFRAPVRAGSAST